MGLFGNGSGLFGTGKPGGSGLLGLGKPGGGGLLGSGFSNFAQAGGAASAFLDGDRNAFDDLRRQQAQQQQQQAQQEQLRALHQSIDQDPTLSDDEKSRAKAYPNAYAHKKYFGGTAGAVRQPLGMGMPKTEYV